MLRERRRRARRPPVGQRQKPMTLSAQMFRSTNFAAGASCADFLLASVCSDTPRAPAQGAHTQIGMLSPTAFWITSLALGIPMPLSLIHI